MVERTKRGGKWITVLSITVVSGTMVMRDGLAEIIREYKDGLIFYLNSIVNNIRLAEELAEDTFVLLGVKKPKDKGKGSFKTWLYTIGRNVAIDQLRKMKNNVPIEQAEDIADKRSLEEAYLQKERDIAVHRAINALKPDHRQIIWLVYFEGLDYKE